MARFLVRRLLQVIPTLAALSVLLFIWLRALPGGPEVALLGERATPEAQAAIRERLGLNDPIPVQYFAYMRDVLRLEFGVSTQTRQPVLEEFLARFPATLELAIAAMVLAVGIGIPLGYLAARRRGGLLDSLVVSGSMIGICTPIFFLAFILKWIFGENLGWLPTFGRQSPGADATHITNLYVLDGLLTREWDAAWDAALHLLLPAVAVASIPFAVVVRMTRASVLEVLGEDYVRTAESKGLTDRVIRGRHVLRNALLPVVTSIGVLSGALLSGAVLTETVFTFNGIGLFVYNGIRNADYPVLMAFIMFIAFTFVMVNLLVDVSYSIIDPRVRVR
jgi:peptide/nickel transport system permease protein